MTSRPVANWRPKRSLGGRREARDRRLWCVAGLVVRRRGAISRGFRACARCRPEAGAPRRGGHLRWLAPRRGSEPPVSVSGVTTCAARSAARAGLETGVPSRGRHPGGSARRALRTCGSRAGLKTGGPGRGRHHGGRNVPGRGRDRGGFRASARCRPEAGVPSRRGAPPMWGLERYCGRAIWPEAGCAG